MVMKPLVLQGHERSITQIRYNRTGDLLFSSAKDANPSVWFSADGERLGTYQGHRGTVWSLDCNWDSTCLVTGAADLSCMVWDVETGKSLSKYAAKSSVRSSNFSYCGQLVCYTTDKQMGNMPRIVTRDIRVPHDATPAMDIVVDYMAKPMCSLWGLLDQWIITGHDDGSICRWDVKNGERDIVNRPHNAQITDLQKSHDDMMLLTASKDKTAKLFHAPTLKQMKTYTTERPVNSAAISPIREHVVLGGGQEAMDVTTTAAKVGKFDARFFNLVFEHEFARVKGHFGPINSLAFHPNGLSFSSGGEDGFIRVHEFDKEYLNFKMEY